MNLRALIFIVLIPQMTSCQIKDPLRDEIVFEDDFNSVADSVLEMSRLLRKLPNDEVVNCFMDRFGNLYINNKNLGSFKTLRLESQDSVLFDSFAKNEIARFFRLINFCARNHISGVYKDGETGIFIFDYRHLDNSYNTIRQIAILEDQASLELIGRIRIILEHRKNMVLLKHN